MQAILNKLSRELSNGDFGYADQTLTHILSLTKYPNTDYELALQLKGAIKTVLDSNNDSVSEHMQRLITLEDSKLVKYVQKKNKKTQKA